MCPNCRAFITTGDRVCPYCDMKLGPSPRARLNTDILGGMIPQARFTTIIILLINSGLYLAEALNPNIGLSQAGASVPWPYESHQLWRLVTAGFLHGGIWHILMNSWVLFDLGAEVEQIYGTSRLIIYYFVSTVTGFFLSSQMNQLSVGSSAGIYGLIGAMLAFGVTDKSSLGQNIKALYTRWLMYGLLLSFSGVLGFGRVDFYAHIGGFAGGFAAGYLASTPRARLLWKEPLIRVLALLCIVMTVGAFALMFLALSGSSSRL